MKPLLIAFSIAALLIGTMILAESKVPVKYSQYFADKQITLTETKTLGEKFLLLPKKKGFVRFEE